MDWRDETRRHRRWENIKNDAQALATFVGILLGRAIVAGILLGVVAVVASRFYLLFG